MNNINPSRRAFLRNGLLLLGAPAIVHAENIMRIIAPPVVELIPATKNTFITPTEIANDALMMLKAYLVEGEYVEKFFLVEAGKQRWNFPVR